jgi:hypothetical protein
LLREDKEAGVGMGEGRRRRRGESQKQIIRGMDTALSQDVVSEN